MKKLSMLVVIVVVLTLIIAGCSPNASTPPIQSKAPESVLRAITEALNNKDAEAATALVAEDVTQTLIPAPSGTGIYQGKEAIHTRFKEVVAGNPTHKLTSCQTSGDKVTCAATYSDDSTKPLGFDLEFNVEAVVQNGLLKTVTWKMTDQSLTKMQAALAKAQPQALALTFAKDKCTFSGPQRVPAGEITITIKAENGAYYGLFIATFDKGKTLDDLNGLPVVPQPDWVHEVDKDEFSTDHLMVTTLKQGPIYLICFNLTGEWKPIGKFGPIEVDQASASSVPNNAPESVLRAITEALNKKDVEAATALLADDVTQTLIPAPSGTGIYQGKEALHARFKEVVAGNPVHKLTGCQTSGDKVTCMATYSDDSTKPLGFDLEFKVDAVVQAGLLKSVTWAMTDASLAKMQAVMTAPTPALTKPAAPLEPEVLASKAGDVIGVWSMRLIQGAGMAHFEFKPDGTYSIVGVSGEAAGVPIDSGKYEIKDNQLKLLDADCTTVKGDVIPCVPIYQVYVTRQGGKPVVLRFVAVDDQGFDRKQTLDKRKLTWVEQ